MSDMMVAAGVPEVALGAGQAGAPSSVPPTFSGAWGDFSKDMAAIAAEQGVSEVQPEQPGSVQPTQAPVTEPVAQVQPPAAQPAQPAAVVPPAVVARVEVPEKFRGPDGNVDQDKLIKSYLEAEKSLKRAQNAAQPAQAVAPQIQANPAIVAQPGASQGVPLSPFEIQVAQDMINEAAAMGFQMPPAQAAAQARIQIRLEEARNRASVAATSLKVQQLEERLETEARQAELNGLVKTNAWIMTPQGQADLIKIREENPHINQSQTPWRDAAIHLLGQRALQGNPGLVNTPIPTGVQQTAQPLPVTPAPISQAPIQLNSPAEVESYIKTLNPQQEAEFWRKAGLKWEAPNPHFKGVF